MIYFYIVSTLLHFYYSDIGAETKTQNKKQAQTYVTILNVSLIAIVFKPFVWKLWSKADSCLITKYNFVFIY